ncbi:hypothetical protein MLD38_023733 [Melastoma candidum]|uniref:Uncharacterized protein n=1 Tax=Melastoma candidum TaxID=119954 RepID=A0ACB9NQJ9_9MYRT|nr:hypothetical protein MLD38_023733 [Melastoma candidum]
MEQFRQVGEVLGSMKALMVLQDEILINRRQCCLLLDVFTMAFNVIASEITHNLKLEERSTKWKALEQPLRQIHKVFKEGEIYIRYCLDSRDWCAKAMILHQNKDCVELHIHNLLNIFPAAIEAIESAGEISGLDTEEIRRKGILLRKKYDKEWYDSKLFQLRYGEEYLVSKELLWRLDTAWKEDRWLLSESLREKRKSDTLTKTESRLACYLLKKLDPNETFDWTMFNSKILTGAKDYQVRHRLGGGNQFKDIDWFGETFMMRHLRGEINKRKDEISSVLLLSHPNILQYLGCFYEEEKDECFMLMESMNKTLGTYIKENSSPKRRILLPLPIVIDIMLQIARGMEYLHSEKVYHGDLNPMNIFIKTRSSLDGHVRVKVSGFGLPSYEHHSSSSTRSLSYQESTNPLIWYAPEILAEQEQQQSESGCNSKFSEKADVYSFGMICFQLLTGKVPFEDSHLQGDRVGQNIRAGERPLFSYLSPKYLVSLTKRCWQADPSLRPSFSSISRILRYVKKFLVMNPENGHHPELQSPPVDYWHVESMFQKEAEISDIHSVMSPVLQIPFQMFVCKIAETERFRTGARPIKTASCDASSIGKDEIARIPDEGLEPANDLISACSDNSDKRDFLLKVGAKSVGRAPVDDLVVPASDSRSVCSEFPDHRNLISPKRSGISLQKGIGFPKVGNQKPTLQIPKQRTLSTRTTKKSDALSVPSPLSRSRVQQGGGAKIS